MTAELRRNLFLAGGGLLAGFALVLTLFGAGELVKRGVQPGDAPVPVASLPAPSSVPDTPSSSEVTRSEEAGAVRPGKPGLAGEQIPAPSPQPSPELEAKAPTFDIIRVEPDGETVIAGRGAPNTTVEMLRDNEPIARALIDPSGQFAIVPPALPPGSSEITLRITEADGQVRLSKERVAIVVSQKRDTKPLIALSAPDQPTVVLSQPDPIASPPAKEAAKAEVKPDAKAEVKRKAKGDGPVPPGVKTGAKDKPTEEAKASDAARPSPAPVKVVSVDAEEGGRLYVTGQASPGATVRLYLNETLVAPGSAGPDGRLAFAIGRGVTPGDYRVRIDEVDSVSGKVKTRSEVVFAFPGPIPKSGPQRPSRERDTVAALSPTKPAAMAPAGKPPAARSPEASVSEPPVTEARTSVLKPSEAKVEEPKGVVPARQAPERQEVAPERQAAMARVEDPRPSIGTSQTSAASTGPVGPEVTSGRAAPARAERSDVTERTVFIPEIGTAKIARGDNLWQISRRVYGKGTRYTVIFDANQSQIRNPDRIYPGQVFVLPTNAAERQDGKRG